MLQFVKETQVFHICLFCRACTEARNAIQLISIIVIWIHKPHVSTFNLWFATPFQFSFKGCFRLGEFRDDGTAVSTINLMMLQSLWKRLADTSSNFYSPLMTLYVIDPPFDSPLTTDTLNQLTNRNSSIFLIPETRSSCKILLFSIDKSKRGTN